MQLSTPIAVNPSPIRINHQTPLMLIGSCFSDHIGLKLQQSGFDVLTNPFGTLYNPLSIALALNHSLDQEEIDSSWLIQHDGLWHSWMHHTRFSHPDPQICLNQCNQTIHTAYQQLQKRPVVLITFGTAFTYRLAIGSHQGRIVANCHKLPPQHFCRTRLTIPSIVETWTPLLNHLYQLGCSVIFTVSPIRHIADGLHQNQLSKAILLLAIDSLISVCANNCEKGSSSITQTNNTSFEYFPAYEILIDQLRDYRFYARDMCHPSDLAVDIIWQQFQDTYMSPATQQRCRDEEKAFRRTQHRPINTSTI